jgi:V8-like Glu-specific endopeptidase
VTNPSTHSAVQVITQGGRYCSGVLIAPNIVATTAHCASTATGVLPLGGASVVPILDVALHPEYVPNAARLRVRSVDLGLLRVSKGSLTLQPAQITTKEVRPEQTVVVGGFGVSVEGNSSTGLQYRTVVLRMQNVQSTTLAWAAGVPGSGICTGDSGGPYLINGEVFAIAAWSTGSSGRNCGNLSQGILLGPQKNWVDRTAGNWASRVIWSGERIASSPSIPISPETVRVPSAPNSPRLPPTSAKPPRASSTGSGFRISPGQFVTNHHVIEDCSRIDINGKPNARVLSRDSKNDLALVGLSGDNGSVATVRLAPARLNEPVTAVGFPYQSLFDGVSVTTGSVSRLSGLGGDDGIIQISAPVQPGNSGGPLLDNAGNVIGVVSSALNALKVAGATGSIPQNVNFAIRATKLATFLKSAGARFEATSNQSPVDGVEMAERATKFTVLIECK